MEGQRKGERDAEWEIRRGVESNYITGIILTTLYLLCHQAFNTHYISILFRGLLFPIKVDVHSFRPSCTAHPFIKFSLDDSE